MPILMFILVLALPVTYLVATETKDPPKLCRYYNVHEGRMIDGPCKE